MGQTELEAALRRDGDDKARNIWRQVEDEVERLRREQQAQLEQQAHSATAERETAVLKRKAARQNETERRAQRCRVEAEAALAERLRELAEAQLDALAVAGGAELFRALAAEIPPHRWERVEANRRDLQLAAELFPAAVVELSEEIIGGLVVQNQGGRVQIENTLGKRLQHLWPELLPELMAELRKKAGEDGAAD